MEEVAAKMPDGCFEDESRIHIRMQGRSMTETEKEEFLNEFAENPDSTHVGFCVMGGLFAEGIDLIVDLLAPLRDEILQPVSQFRV